MSCILSAGTDMVHSNVVVRPMATETLDTGDTAGGRDLFETEI